MNRELVFSARDNGVTSFMDKMRRSAVDVGRGILQDSMAQSKNAKEAISHYEKQIALIQQKNRLQRDSARAEATDLRDKNLRGVTTEAGGKAANEKFAETIKGIGTSSKEQQLQIDLLKELISAVKSSSEKELRQDQIDSKRESENLEALIQGEDGDEFRTTAQKLRQERHDEDVSKTKRDSKGGVIGVVGSASSVAQSQDGESAIKKTAEAVGKGPILGTVVGILLGAYSAFKLRTDREVASEQYAALSGRVNKSVVDSEIGRHGINALGVTRAQFLESILPGAARSAGTTIGAEQTAIRQLQIEKGLALTSGTGQSLTRLSRVAGGLDEENIINSIYSAMYGTGAFGKGNNDMSRMQDIVSGFVGFSEGEFSRAGATNTMGTLKTMRGLQQLGGRFVRDDYAMQTVSQLNAGLATEGTAEARAIKFDILRKQNPGMSMFELQNQMAQGINSPGYLQGVLDFVKNTGGDLNAQSFLMQGLTGGQMRGKDISDILRGKMSVEDFADKDIGIAGKASIAHSPLHGMFQALNDTFKDGMSSLGGGYDEMKEFYLRMTEQLEEINKNTKVLND